MSKGPMLQTALTCVRLGQFCSARLSGGMPGCLALVGCIRCSGSLQQKRELIWFLRCSLLPQSQREGCIWNIAPCLGWSTYLRHGCQRAIQSLKPHPGLSFWISLEEKATTKPLICTKSYLGNGKAEFGVFLRWKGVEFIPPRSSGGCMNCHL